MGEESSTRPATPPLVNLSPAKAAICNRSRSWMKPAASVCLTPWKRMSEQRRADGNDRQKDGKMLKTSGGSHRQLWG